ncbi:ClpP-like prohead protease/major capsid protein fusion protein [Pseudomonas oryzihabitans]|uniref:ClpP-like prohead protease/major capsid protein fusion protein n=1 Tax=Pseudomonas oryzihabitans TaxID=47885 RepID=UPI0011A97484|nr:ClpP-like prohead protease/major capsid protein fusion protein [Pseudomonas oryzihabitans]
MGKRSNARRQPPALRASPRAAITDANRPSNSWYSIRATAAGPEIFLYGDIGAWGITAQQFARDLQALGDVPTIFLRIHSPGGDVFEGMAIYNMLKNHPAYVDGTIDGLAASMGSVIAMACNVLRMPANAMMMIHKPWGAAGGDAEEMRRYADLLDKVEGTLMGAYTAKTGKTAEELAPMLAAETWMNGEEAVAAGFADELLEPLQAAAALTSQRLQDYANMPEALRNLLNPRGQATPPANVVPPVTPPAPAAAGETPEQIQARLNAAEDVRRDGIRAAFGPTFATSQATLLNTLLLDRTVTVEAASAQLLQALGRDTAPLAGTFHRVDNGNLIGDSIVNSIEARLGLAAAERDNDFLGMSLMELARCSLTHRGVGVAGMDRMGIVGSAFTHSTSDFGSLLANIAQKAMLKGFDEAEETFQLWTSAGVLTDFREAARVDLGAFSSLDKIPENGEYKQGTIGDRGEKIILATYGKLFTISRQAIINDDLSAFGRIPRAMGRAAIRTVGDLVYALLKANRAMSDGKALFHADHGNLLAAGALSIARIDEAKTKMRRQKDKDATLNIRPKYMLAPVSLESTARALLAAEYDPQMAEAKVPNPVRGLVEVISDARLDDQSLVDTYLVADPAIHDTVEVAYLDGNDKPYIEQQDGFTVDGARFKVRLDAGVAPTSYRGMVKAPGK